MKRFTAIIIALAILAVLGAILILIKTGAFEPKDQGDDDIFIGDDEDEDYIEIDKIDKSKVNGISLDLSGETLSYEKRDGKWIYPACEGFTVDESIIEAMINSLEKIDGYRVICEDCESKAEYGLEEPSSRIDLTFSDGGKKSYLFGDFSNYSQAYYFAIEGEKKVYLLVDKITAFCNKSLKDTIVCKKAETMPAASSVKTVVSGEKTITSGDEGAGELITALCSLSYGKLVGMVGYGSDELLTSGTTEVTLGYTVEANEVKVDESVTFTLGASEDKLYMIGSDSLIFEASGSGNDKIIALLFQGE